MAARRLTGSAAPLLCAVVIAFITAACPARVHAEQSDQSPIAFVKALGDDVVSVLRNTVNNGGRRRAQLKAIFLRAFDVQAIARFVLGIHWRRATADQKSRFMAAFPDYVADIYAAQFADYSGERFAVIRQQQFGKGRTLVVTEIRRPNAPKIEVDFRVESDGSKYKIIDVVVDQLSLVVTKRDEFDSFIRRQGLDALIASLKRHVEKGD